MNDNQESSAGEKSGRESHTSAMQTDSSGAGATQRGLSLISSEIFAIALDAISIAAGVTTGLSVYSLCRGNWFDIESVTLFALTVQYAVAFVLFGRIQDLYRSGHSLLNIRQTAGVLRASTFCCALQAVGLLFSRLVVPRLFLILIWFFITSFVLLQKQLSRKLLATWKRKNTAARNVLILGTGAEARRVFSFLLNSPDHRLAPVGFLSESGDVAKVIYSHDYRFRKYAPVYEGLLNNEILSQLAISDIIVADSGLSNERLSEIQLLAAEHLIELAFVGSAHPQLSGQVSCLVDMDGLIVTSLASERPVPSGLYEASKRLVDIVAALLLLVFSLPVWVVVATWIKVTSAGAVLFRQRRVGQHGRQFEMYKFRSMYITAANYERSPERGDDPRITPVGRFIRKSSLDELPQLLNVLLGDMSLVGPRPEMPYVVVQYSAHQAQRLKVKQGLTGLWQLSADRKFAIHESIEYDLYYLEHRSFFLDMAILLHTIAFAMKGI